MHGTVTVTTVLLLTCGEVGKSNIRIQTKLNHVVEELNLVLRGYGPVRATGLTPYDHLTWPVTCIWRDGIT